MLEKKLGLPMTWELAPESRNHSSSSGVNAIIQALRRLRCHLPLRTPLHARSDLDLGHNLSGSILLGGRELVMVESTCSIFSGKEFLCSPAACLKS
ncbi:hypothetical protein M758_UG015200 [Ceratodon purpureus]|nr:hypothetical protein M758_UG015200 [Ceratodon purpureus]